jgi:DNA-binding NarL/FixJ family response regulator
MQTRSFSSGVLTDAVRARLRSYRLTPREEQIVELVLHGMSNRAIAQASNITEQTVKDHLKHVFRKTGVNQRTVLMANLLQSPVAHAGPQPVAAKGPAGFAGARQTRRRAIDAAD